MTHTCHAHGCTLEVPPRMLFCLAHWKMLEPEIQRAVWREYRKGQEVDKEPSLRYLAVQRWAVGRIAFQPNDEAAARAAAAYITEAFFFQVKAINAGLGDPLEGLVPDER